MTIVFGTDFSGNAEIAFEAAGALARKLQLPLKLVHAVSSDDENAKTSALLRCQLEAERARERFGVSAEGVVREGPAHRCLLEVAMSDSARLIVVGALGAAARPPLLGGVPERLAQASSLPVLIVRESTSWSQWSSGNRELRVLLGTGLGESSKTALRWVQALPDAAIAVAYVAWPYQEHVRLGIHKPIPLDHLEPELSQLLERDLREWVASCPGSENAELLVTPGWGRLDTHLAQLAREKSIDVLTVGSHQRNFFSRAWQGSVSRGAIYEATCNVLCVPASSVRVTDAGVRAPRTVVIPITFDALSERAIGVGYGLAPEGAVVHLIHVLSPDQPNEAKAHEALSALVPKGATALGIVTVLHVVRAAKPGLAISQYAARVGADVVCMATHTRVGLSRILLGSQAQEVLERSRIPVMLVPPDRES